MREGGHKLSLLYVILMTETVLIPITDGIYDKKRFTRISTQEEKIRLLEKCATAVIINFYVLFGSESFSTL